jgi:hypothetical protein
MKTHERYEALLKIKSELEQWQAFYPEHRVRLHGGLKHVNEAYQLCKQLIQHEALNLLAEDSQESGLYDDNPCASISLHNIE